MSTPVKSPLTTLTEPSDSFHGNVVINLSDNAYSYILSNEVDGKILMPGMSYVVIVWRIIAKEFFFKQPEEVPVIIKKLTFKRVTVLSTKEDNIFDVQITKTGYFEIHESGSLVVTGYMKGLTELPESLHGIRSQVDLANDNLIVKRNDFYKNFYLRGQRFGVDLRKVLECNVAATLGKVEWCGNFHCFLETVVHLSTLRLYSKELAFETSVEKIIIDPKAFLNIATQQKEINVSYDPQLNITRCVGIKVVELITSKITRKNTKIEPVLETQQFVYYRDLSKKYNFVTALSIALQIVLQNCIGIVKKPKICEIIPKETNSDILSIVKSILDRQPFTEADYYQVSPEECDIISTNDFLMSELKGFQSQTCLTDQEFILHISNNEVRNCNVDIVFECATDTCYVYLFRTFHGLRLGTLYREISNPKFEWMNDFENTVEYEQIHLVSEGRRNSGIVGLIKCLCTEEPIYRATMIDEDNSCFSLTDERLLYQIMQNLSINVRRNGKWGTFVHFPFVFEETKEVPNAAVLLEEHGDLSTLKWVQSPTDHERTQNNEEVACVFYSGITREDVLLATGELQKSETNFDTDLFVGHEFSGTCGERRIMGLIDNGGLSLHTSVHPNYLWEVPSNWSLQDAATVPAAYSLGYYALTLKCPLEQKQSVLVYTGGNPMALAGISIAQGMDCTLFVITRSDTDKKMVQATFPLLNDKFIGFDSDEIFAKFILDNTNQRGVDCVLTYAETDMESPSPTKLLSRNGCYIEFDPATSSVASVRSVPTQIFYRITLNQVFNFATVEQKKIRMAVAEGLQNGTVKPLPRIVFQEMEVEPAFKYAESHQHLDKVLVELRKESDEIFKFPRRTIAARARLYFNSKKSYVVIGGTGELGLELTDWMITRGATKIILNSRSGVTTGYQALCLHKWSKYRNVSVQVYTDDTTTLSGARELLQKATILGPVGGIFLMAMVFKDGTIREQTSEDFQNVFKPKLVSASNLDIFSRGDCPEIDYFVAFSSIASGRGCYGQSSYGMANSAIEQLCEKRTNDNLPGLAIQWGPIGVAEADTDNSKLNVTMKKYLATLPIGSCLSILEKFMLQSSPICSCTLLPEYNNEVSEKVQTAAQMVCLILGIQNYDAIDKSFTLAELGLNSLMNVEVKQNLYRDFKLELNLDQISKMTLTDLSKISNR